MACARDLRQTPPPSREEFFDDGVGAASGSTQGLMNERRPAPIAKGDVGHGRDKWPLVKASNGAGSWPAVVALRGLRGGAPPVQDPSARLPSARGIALSALERMLLFPHCSSPDNREFFP